ncbi:MAG: DUF5685 family protein [Lachnospiraceae bacterium]
MFGYVTVNKPEMKIKDYRRYHAYYCGLCRTLGEHHGLLGKMTLTYDMTFLIILLTSLYETQSRESKSFCLVHPMKLREMLINEITEYAADMNIALSYHHLLDDWADDKSVAGFGGAMMLKTKYKKIEKKYPRQCAAIEQELKNLQEFEHNKETSLDAVSACFGRLMEELLVYQQGMWENELRRIGFYLGAYIYLMDAYMDLDSDVKKRRYNPLLSYREQDDYEDYCFEILTMMISEVANSFEKLPCIEEADIIRNILYGGVWSKYNKKRLEEEQSYNKNGTIGNREETNQ